nr:Hint domain-containing protein [Micromonospora sp. A200]
MVGINDAKRCLDGQASGCFWTAVAFLGYAKAVVELRILAKGADVAHDAHAAKSVRTRTCAFKSFSGDTHVLMADGSTKAIEDIEVGELVLATDPETGEQGPRKVTHVWVHDDDLINLELSNGATLTTTDDHPFWNHTDQQWQEVKDLDRGDLLHSGRGTSDLAAVGLNPDTTQRAAAYNLTVAGIHTYYVLAGNTPVLVHNTDPCLGPVQNPSRGSTARRDHVDWEEELLLEVRENPAAGVELWKVPQTDPRWPRDKGWVKMEQTIDGIDVHYQYQITTGAVDDLKVKDHMPGADERW